jgi:hypothetical protein
LKGCEAVGPGKKHECLQCHHSPGALTAETQKGTKYIKNIPFMVSSISAYWGNEPDRFGSQRDRAQLRERSSLDILMHNVNSL